MVEVEEIARKGALSDGCGCGAASSFSTLMLRWLRWTTNNDSILDKLQEAIFTIALYCQIVPAIFFQPLTTTKL